MNILIVDDERHIVDYLYLLLNTRLDDEHDIRKAHSASDALSMAGQQKIDLALLDIQMPGMTGLTLSEKITAAWPRCHIIFLTAYDSFDYIYQANKIPHSSYLLKTEPDAAILKEVHAHLEQIAGELAGEVLLDDARRKERLLSHLQQQSILKELLYVHNLKYPKPDKASPDPLFPLDLSRPVYLAYMVLHLRTIDEYLTNISALAMEYLTPAEKFLEDRFTFSMLDMSHGAMLWFFQPKEAFSSCETCSCQLFLKCFSEDLINYSMSVLHRNLNCILYPEAVSFEQLRSTYYSLLQQLENSPSTSSATLCKQEPVKKSTAAEQTAGRGQGFTDQKLSELSFSLYQNNPEEYFRTLEELHQVCTGIQSMHSLEAIQIYLGISMQLVSYLSLYRLDAQMNARITLHSLYHLEDFSSWENVFDYLQTFSRHLFDLLSVNKTDKNNAVIQKIKTYIKDHLTESISLSTLSAIVNYNETYISRLFKQTTGIKLSDYIYQERINKAKYLLSTTAAPIQQIAADCGFDSSQYFSLAFKKAMGISPSEYQRVYYKNAN